MTVPPGPYSTRHVLRAHDFADARGTIALCGDSANGDVAIGDDADESLVLILLDNGVAPNVQNEQ